MNMECPGNGKNIRRNKTPKRCSTNPKGGSSSHIHFANENGNSEINEN